MLVVAMIDDAGYSAHGLAILPGQGIDAVAIFVGGIAFGIEHPGVIRPEWWNPVGVVDVNLARQVDEGLHLSF